MKHLAFLVSLLAARPKCPQNGTVSWTKEHVIPKSWFKNQAKANDDRNLIWFPNKLNHLRSNMPYVATRAELGNAVKEISHACHGCNIETCPWNASYSLDPPGFLPPDAFKPYIFNATFLMLTGLPSGCLD